jgi:hypothetical protein
MAANPSVAAATEHGSNHWSAHRGQAFAIRAVVYLGPIVTSIVFVHYAGKVVPAPLSALWLFLVWWFGLSLGVNRRPGRDRQADAATPAARGASPAVARLPRRGTVALQGRAEGG